MNFAECSRVSTRTNANKSVIFADESGDHGLPPLNPEYPVFVIALCLVDINYYIDVVCPLLQKVKFKYFGHDGVILHERDIRKHTGAFSILRESALRENFHRDVSQVIEALEFKIFATVIDKREYQASGLSSHDMYFVAMSTSLEQASGYLEGTQTHSQDTVAMFESRGAFEDRKLAKAFGRIAERPSEVNRPHSFEKLYVAKSSNSLGLQLSDLVARPFGVAALRPDQPNRAYEILIPKIESLDTVSSIEANFLPTFVKAENP